MIQKKTAQTNGSHPARSRNNTERKRAEEALRRRMHELGERFKELTCLRRLSNLLQNPSISVDEILQGTTALLRPAWQYPITACARIILDGREFATENFRETPWRQSCDIVVHGERSGNVEVCYLDERPESDEGPFLKEERILINTIAERLGRVVERMRAEEALRESERRFRTLSEASFEGIAIHRKGTMLEANQALAAMFGYELSEAIRMHVLDFVAPESRDAVLQSIVSKSREPFEFTGLRKDGTTFPVEVCGRPIPYQGKMVTVAALRDLTERKQAEEALEKAREELEARVERQMEQGNPYGLAFRELTVLHQVAAGKADKEIGLELGISPLTASKHLTNILGKMGAASRTEAGVRALREGLLD